MWLGMTGRPAPQSKLGKLVSDRQDIKLSSITFQLNQTDHRAQKLDINCKCQVRFRLAL